MKPYLNSSIFHCNRSAKEQSSKSFEFPDRQGKKIPLHGNIFPGRAERISCYTFNVTPTLASRRSHMKKWLVRCPWRVLLFAFLLGFCSVGTQLLLTAFSSALLGARVLHYGTNLTLFLAALGTGAIFSRRMGNVPILIVNQWAIGLLLSSAVPTLYWLALNQLPVAPAFYFFVVLLGCLFGFQIPQTFHYAFPAARSRKGAIPILGAVYLGGFLGSLSVGLFLYPLLGYFPMGATLAILSIASCFCLIEIKPKVTLTTSISVVLFLLTALQLFSAPRLRANMESQLITRRTSR
jgi:predicted membrane-bound spermidine synthase